MNESSSRGPLNERAQSGSRLRAALARKWAERASRTEGPCAFYYIEFMSLKHKVPQGYSPADLPIHAKSGRKWGPENAGLAYAFRDDDIIKVGKYQANPPRAQYILGQKMRAHTAAR